MRKRDIFIILVSAIGIILLLQQEGSISLVRGFYEKLAVSSFIREDSHQQEIFDENDYKEDIPRPIITDLNGDGVNEMIIASKSEIKIKNFKKLQLRSTSTEGEFIQILQTEKTKTLIDENSDSETHIVGLSAGYLDKNSPKIVVVLSDWTLLCLDHELKILWRQKISDEKKSPSEVVISVIPYRVHINDKGMILVGARIQNYQEHSHKKHSEKFEEASHYSYYAFDGASGALRWKHESTDFHYEDEKTIPQHNYKLDVRKRIQHSGEVHWRHYKEDLFKHFPHLYRHPHDIHFEIDHFIPSSKRKKESKDIEHEFGEIGTAFSEGMKRFVGDRKESNPPNVLVAHLRNGIEVIHLYTGRTITQIGPLKKDVSYGDFNHDGTIDVAESIISSKGCIGKISSGMDGVVPLFNTSICELKSALQQFSFNVLQERNNHHENLFTIPPAIVTRYDGLSSRIVHDIVFIVSSGLVTSVTLDGKGKWREKWKVYTPSQWASNSEIDRDREIEDLTFPQIVAYPLRKGQKDDFIIAVGEQFISIIDHSGTVQHVMNIPHPPIAPIIFADINNDNINDIIITTKNGYYGFIVKTHSGMSVLSVLVISMVVILGLMYISTQVNLNDPYFQKTILKE